MKKIIILLSLVVFFLLAYTFIESRWIEVKEISLVNSDIPDAFKGTKIVFMSDIHYGRYFSKKRISSLVSSVNNLKPDIILLGGDYVLHAKDIGSGCFEEFKNLKASIGVYGVLGNHDHREGADKIKKELRDVGVVLLDNDARWIYKEDKRIKIGGVGDFWYDKQDLSPTISDVDKNDFVILLSHNPDFAEEITTDKIDYVFSGHTHGGQATFFGLWAPVIPSKYGQKYRTGIIETQNTNVLLTHGVGSIYPVRFFARPQITVINL